MDILRKLIHMSMGLFALALRWLSPWQAMLCALLAFLHNLYIFPLYGRKKLEKDEEKKRGYTAIVSYPAVVFVIIGLAWAFNPFYQTEAMPLAAAVWGILAFGDAFGAIIGQSLKGPKLPWNREKTISGIVGFTVFGFLASYLLFSFVSENSIPVAFKGNSFLNLLIITTVLAAIVESLEGQFDDNLAFPLVALALLSFYQYIATSYKWSFISTLFSHDTAIGLGFLGILLAINTALAVTALIKKWVSLSGFIFGILVGFSVILSLGPKGFFLLCLFYLFANFSTFYGMRIKEARGIAEGNKGTRGLESIFSKGLAPAVFCWLSFEAFVVALAFYAADTVATEFGKTSKKGTFTLLSFKSVKPGTVGAVSAKGTIAGIISIFAFLMIALLDYRTFTLDPKMHLALCLLVLVFFLLESVVNELNAKYQLTSKMVIHITLGFLIGAFSNSVVTWVWMKP